MPTQNTKGVDTMKKNCSKRKDGRWQYSKQQNGILYYAIANTYRELIEKIKDIKPRQIKTVKKFKETQTTFIQYFDFYITNYVKNKKISEKTIKEWDSIKNNYIIPNFKHIYLNKLTTEQVQNFIDNINKERTQERIYQKIIKVLHKAYVTKKIKNDITLGLEKPKRQNKQERSPLTLHQQIALLKAVKNTKIYAFTIFSLIIGSRREETMKFNLKTDVNEKKLQIHIKGTKTINADRYVNVTKEFIQFLKQNMGKDTFDFGITYPTKELKKIFDALKIKNSCLHCLRHTCSANLYFLKADDKYRQLQLGHASIVTTNDIYTNIKENIKTQNLRRIYGDLYPKFD